MGTMRSSEESQGKREAILAAARTLFAQKGYEETTIADIAREAGIAVGTVYLYFRRLRSKRWYRISYATTILSLCLISRLLSSTA